MVIIITSAILFIYGVYKVYYDNAYKDDINCLRIGIVTILFHYILDIIYILYMIMSHTLWMMDNRILCYAIPQFFLFIVGWVLYNILDMKSDMPLELYEKTSGIFHRCVFIAFLELIISVIVLRLR